jgi:hypothetical protein
VSLQALISQLIAAAATRLPKDFSITELNCQKRRAESHEAKLRAKFFSPQQLLAFRCNDSTIHDLTNRALRFTTNGVFI